MLRPTIRAVTGFECEPGRVTTANLPPHPNKCGRAPPSLYGEEELGLRSGSRQMVKGHAPRFVARIERRIPHQTWKDFTGPRSDILSLETAIAPYRVSAAFAVHHSGGPAALGGMQ